MRAPTGEQYELVRQTPLGEARAVITEVAAGIRRLTVGDADLLEPFPAGSTPPGAAGIVLAPWPNRVRDGRWTLRGAGGAETVQQLALTEPARGNASHGLLRFTAYDLVEKDAASLTLQATIHPQTGYPFLVDTTVRYELVDDGLSVTHTFANGGQAAAPVAVGAHPYFRLGERPTAELLLTVHATTHFEVDERLNPVAEHPVAGTAFDLRTPRPVGELELDDGFGGAGPGELAALTAADGARVALWGDASFRYVQAFTNRSFATRAAGEVAVALEPMTAPANAFNSGAGLRLIEPGETWSAAWGIRYTPAA